MIKTSWYLSKCVKKHSKEGKNSAIYQHCSTKDHPLPNIDQFKVIDQEVSLSACEAKEATHIQKLHQELNKNVGKIVISSVFDSLLCVKPKNPIYLQFFESMFQSFNLNLTQFHSQIDKRMRCSNRAQIAKISHQINYCELSNANYLQLFKFTKVLKRCCTPLAKLNRSSIPLTKFP